MSNSSLAKRAIRYPEANHKARSDLQTRRSNVPIPALEHTVSSGISKDSSTDLPELVPESIHEIQIEQTGSNTRWSKEEGLGGHVSVRRIDQEINKKWQYVDGCSKLTALGRLKSVDAHEIIILKQGCGESKYQQGSWKEDAYTDDLG